MTKDLSSEYLKAIAKHGNFSSAARALYISQPYLSKFVKKLEEEIGVELINRNETPLSLTYAGERYLAYMEEIEQTYIKMKHEIEAITNLKRGRLKLGINPILGSHTLYNLLPNFISAYPGIEIDLVEHTAIEIEALLLERKIDICLNMLPIFHPDINYENLYDEKLYIVIPEGHKLYNPNQETITHLPFDFKLLDREDFILLKTDLGLRRVTDEIFKTHSIDPNVKLETINIENAYRLANSGIGLTIIPECIMKNNFPTKSNFYTFGNPLYKNNVVVAYKKKEPLSAPALAFLDMAKANYKKASI
ncbi:transcriptional regulator [Alkalihalophilus pseudofirmus]|nr:transcriptional regulator [Alkalihalophilus pseudofirmus]